MLRTFGVAFALALTGAIAPGPVLVLVIGQVLAQGIWAAIYIIIGHALLESLLVFGLSRGLKTLLIRPQFRALLGIIGGVVLFWMGWLLFCQSKEVLLEANKVLALSPIELILAGIVVSLSNPYFTGWWATVGTGQFAALRLSNWKDYSAFFMGHELGDMAWYLFVAVVVTAGRGWLLGGAYGIVLRISAVVILIFGAGFIVVSIKEFITKTRLRSSSTE